VKCTIEVGSGAMIYTLRFIGIGLGFQKLFWEGECTHTQQDDLISLMAAGSSSGNHLHADSKSSSSAFCICFSPGHSSHWTGDHIISS
jgi:hypothetical protein